MGLDQFLGRYKKANLTKKEFDYDEYQDLINGKYNTFKKLPDCFRNIATKITAAERYYDMEKIARDFADGHKVYTCSFCGDKVGFRSCESDVKFELTMEQLNNDYTKEVIEALYLVEGTFEVAYWRKANQIREWFINHLDGFEYDDNGEYYAVTEEILEELIDDCQKVLDDNDLAEEILPTSSGFFFGSTEYDEWYFEQLKTTIEQVNVVLATTDWNSEVVVYTESW